jgi:recombinational DNA repair ATPase RecF
MDKDRVLAHHTPFWIEISAAFLLLFNICMFSLSSIADRPMFFDHSCIMLKNKYLKRLEFYEEYNQKTFKILKIGDNNYLLSYKNNFLYEMPIKEDFKYKEVSCD